MTRDLTSKGMYPAPERNGKGIPVAVLGEAVVLGLDDLDRRRDGLRKANVDRRGRSAVRRRPRHAVRPPVPQVHQDTDARRVRPFRGKLGRHAMESVS